MKCEDVEKSLIAYADDVAAPAERRDVESHLADCAACRARVAEFRAVSSLLGELPAIEPSFGFDARVRQRVAAEPQPGWFAWLVPQARLALSAAMLVALTVLMLKLPGNRSQAPVPVASTAAPATASSDQDFEAIKDLGVLENYDVLTKFDEMSESAAAIAPQLKGKTQSSEPTSND
jgi:anti-sigma factor RsiW